MIASLALTLTLALSAGAQAEDLKGAWRATLDDGTTGTMILTDDHFSIAWYQSDPAQFVSTMGGIWSIEDGVTRTEWEYCTSSPELVGTTQDQSFELVGDTLRVGGHTWTRIDDGTPGSLEGAWLITGRKRDGEIRTSTPGARRTMKILSGTRFQWIAYNAETGEFFGTGGGTYTTNNGRYTENLEFFSRDATRVGASLPFEFEVIDGGWHHSGKSSKGEPLYEVWTRRSDLGI